MKKRKMEFTGGIAVLLLLACLMAAPAAAKPYAYDGYPLETVESGTIFGDVFVSAGTNYGLPDSSYAYQPNSLTTTYYLPPGDSVEWAKLCVGVWGGKNTATGYVNVTLDGDLLGPNEDLDKDSPGSHSTCVGYGVWGVEYYDIEDVISDKLGQSVTCVVNTWNTSDADGVKFDGRIYGTALVMAYKNCSSNCTAYWINNGLENLNYVTPHYGNKTVFEGCLPDCAGGEEAELWLGYYASDYGHPDFAYFNVPGGAGTPQDYDEIEWTRASYRDYQLDNEDVADEMGNAVSYFDLKSFTTTYSSTLIDELKYCNDENYVVYRNGYDYNSDGFLNCSWSEPNKEGESYYTPFVAVFKVRDICLNCTYDFSEGAGTVHYAYYNEEFDGTLTNVNAATDEFPSGGYTAIASDDASTYTTSAVGDYAAHRFVFNVSDCPSCCREKLKVKWIGSIDSGGATMYLWDDDEYVDVATSTSSGEITLVYEAPVNEYINNDLVNVLVVPNDSGEDISTDYIRLQLCTDLG